MKNRFNKLKKLLNEEQFNKLCERAISMGKPYYSKGFIQKAQQHVFGA